MQLFNIFKNIKNIHPIFLSLISAFCFWLSWPPYQGVPLLWIVFVPILLIRRYVVLQHYQRPFYTFLKYTYLTMILWNLVTIWWLKNSTIEGCIFTLFVNAFCLMLPLAVWYYVRKHLGLYWGYSALIIYWISMEYVHLFWELSFPWLNLGNGLASFPKWIQWYEYTGVFGGTLWILIANIAIYHIVLEKSTSRRLLLFMTSMWIVIPIAGSYYIYFNYKEKGDKIEAIVIQPNIDPYTEKFLNSEYILSPEDQLMRCIHLSQQVLTENSQLLLWPESAIDYTIEDIRLTDDPLIKYITQFIKFYPKLFLISGLGIIKQYGMIQATKTAYKDDRGHYCDYFNSMVCLHPYKEPTLYHKIKLVIGGERIPYGNTLPNFLISLIQDMMYKIGGIIPFCGQGKEPKIFYCTDTIKNAPIICYESIFGNFIGEFIRKGATVISIVTNDGWFKSKIMCQQHLYYSRLRAIEHRRSVIRSANAGISAFINQRGDLMKCTSHTEQSAIKHEIQANTLITFYTMYGDYIAVVCVVLAIFIFLFIVIKKSMRLCT